MIARMPCVIAFAAAFSRRAFNNPIVLALFIAGASDARIGSFTIGTTETNTHTIALAICPLPVHLTAVLAWFIVRTKFARLWSFAVRT